MSKTIKADSVVYMHYTLRLKDGSVADSSLDEDKPGRFQMGEQDVSEAFEKQLLGLKVGDKKHIELKAAEAFGESDSRNIKMLPADKFSPDEEIEEGVIMSFDMMDGQEVLGTVRKVDNGIVLVDFNHPLAGQDVAFDVQIVKIE